jgi:acetyl-CoA acetyltransferase
MAAIHMAYLEIVTGVADAVLFGDMEHMTRVPDSLLDEGGHLELFEDEKYRHWDMHTAWNMGYTAVSGSMTIPAKPG